jgi:SAM-dependent methyltransferase
LPQITTDEAVLERVLPLAGKDVLDVGCGSGRLVRELCARSARVVGIEVSEEQLALARERDRSGSGRYLVGRAEELPIANASIDVVVFMRSLHHVAVEQMTAALREARRVLREGGSVYVAEPLAEGSFFDLVSLVEDERSVRAAAQDAIGRAAEAGLRRTTTREYAVEGRYAGVEAFRTHMLSVAPDRAETFTARETEITLAFARLGEPGTAPGERRFVQAIRVDVLKADADSSKT